MMHGQENIKHTLLRHSHVPGSMCETKILSVTEFHPELYKHCPSTATQHFVYNITNSATGRDLENSLISECSLYRFLGAKIFLKNIPCVQDL